VSEFFLPKHRPGLFRSHAWLSAWQASWGNSVEIHPLTQTNESVLATAIFARKYRLKKLFPITTAFPLGISTTAAPSIRSEYFCCPETASTVDEYIANYIKTALHYSWDQFYIPDVLEDSEEAQAIKDVAKKNGLECIVKEIDTVYAVNLKCSNFDDYLKQLGSNTRLKLFNRRKNLQKIGQINIANIWPDQELFYSLLNQFHEQRWGKVCYQGKNLKFMRLLLDALAEQGHVIDLSVMSVNQQPVSVVLDILIDGRIYNLQSGYLENYAKNISLGTLHFGFQVEAAFANNNAIDVYDFMAGVGKNSNYKSALANCTGEFNSFLLVRSPLLKILYRLQKRFR
jgi:hypothetical protein